MVRPGEPIQVGVQDVDGRVVTASGPVPEPARTKPLTAEAVGKQLARTGGTPYRCARVRALVEPDLSVPVATLNALRRQVLEELSRQRGAVPESPKVGPFHAGVRYENRKDPPVFTLSLRSAAQLTRELCALKPALLYLPAEEIAQHPKAVETALDTAGHVGVILPRICWDREREELDKQLTAARSLGVTDALVGTLDLIAPAREHGFTLRGDFGLPIFNSQAIKELKRLGFVSCTASFELKLAQIRDLSKLIDLEIMVYGRLPLMITENCILKNRDGGCKRSCEGENRLLVDRKGERFPVLRAPGCRSEIFNAKRLYLADKAADYRRVGAWGARLSFTTESASECLHAARQYLGQERFDLDQITRGLYYRDVE